VLINEIRGFNLFKLDSLILLEEEAVKN